MTCSLLSQNISAIFHEELMTCSCSWLIHYLFTTFSQFSSQLIHDLFRTCSHWLVHHLFTTWSLLVHELLELLLVKDLFSICSLPYSWLVHDLFTTYSWLVHNFLPFFHNLFMYLQDLFTTFFLQFFHNLFMTCLGLVHLSTASSWLVQYLLMTCSRLVDDLLIAYSWLVHDLFTGCSQLFHNFFRTYLWLVLVLFITCSQKFHTFSQLGNELFRTC